MVVATQTDIQTLTLLAVLKLHFGIYAFLGNLLLWLSKIKEFMDLSKADHPQLTPHE